MKSHKCQKKKTFSHRCLKAATYVPNVILMMTDRQTRPIQRDEKIWKEGERMKETKNHLNVVCSNSLT
jgi:hypothetical protein